MCLAIPAQIVSLVEGPPHGALVDVAGERQSVDVTLVEPDGIAPGDWVLTLVGFALTKINEDEAVEQMRLVTELNDTQAALAGMLGYVDDVTSPDKRRYLIQ